MAEIVPCRLEPLPPANTWDDVDAGDSVVQFYEHLRKRIGSHPSCFSLGEAHLFWHTLAQYKDKNKAVLDLKKRLNAPCKLFQYALERTSQDA